VSSTDEAAKVRLLDVERLAERMSWIAEPHQIVHLVLTDDRGHKPGWVVNAHALPNLLRALADVVEKKLGDTVTPDTHRCQAPEPTRGQTWCCACGIRWAAVWLNDRLIWIEVAPLDVVGELQEALPADIAAVGVADELDPLRYQAVGAPELLSVAGLQASLVEKIDAGTQLVYALYHVHGKDQLDWLKAAPDPVHRANARAQSAYGVGRRSPHAETEPS
jgi:hypothetical protein